MKKTFASVCFFLVLFFSLGGCVVNPSQDGPLPVNGKISVMSINIAGQDMTEPDYISSVRYPGQTGNDYTYELRRKRLDLLIEEARPDVILLQEVSGNQWWWQYLVSNEDSFLNTFPQYDFVGRTNRNGDRDGNGAYWYDLYNQIYYNKNKFDLLDSGMFYLNEKRTEPFSAVWHESAAYDPDDNAICTWAVLEKKSDGQRALYASTHLKTAPTLARSITNYRQAINLADGLYRLAEEHADENGALPVLVGGDFNMSVDQLYNRSYSFMTETAGYSDLRDIADKTDFSGTARIWGRNKNATGNDGSTSDGYRIDYFFAQGFEAINYKVYNGSFVKDGEEEYYDYESRFDGTGYDLSDHLPIYAEVRLSGERIGVNQPGDPYRNTATEGDPAAKAGEPLKMTTDKLVFDSDEILSFIGKESAFMSADLVSDAALGNVLKLTATESCANVHTYIDYAGLAGKAGISPPALANYRKIRITYKTVLTEQNSEFAVGFVGAGETVKYGTNTVNFRHVESDFYTVTLDLPQNIGVTALSKIYIGTMAYASDYSGICGMYAGDAVYLYSIEFIV